MAKKKTTEKPEHTCRDCANCHSHYNIGHEGREILGKCKKREHSQLLKQGACREFEKIDLTL